MSHVQEQVPRAPARTRDAGSIRSLLFDSGVLPSDLDTIPEPDYFHDLNLDQLIRAAVSGRDGYALEAIYRWRIADADGIRYRQEVFRHLESGDARGAVESFAAGMQNVRGRLDLITKLHHPLQKQRSHLAAVIHYCTTLSETASLLRAARPHSIGLRHVAEDLDDYVRSPGFEAMFVEARKLEDRLGEVDYALLIKGSKVTVGHYDGEANYTKRVESIFERFREAVPHDYRHRVRSHADIDHVQGAILDMVAELNEEVFGALRDFTDRHSRVVSSGIEQLDREIQFYLSYLSYLEPVRAAGLPFCYPTMSTDKTMEVNDGFDVVLANKLAASDEALVLNDFYLRDGERILVVSGPNQGGKTTLARAIGQLHHLTELGCPVPGARATVHLPDRIFTHFEREESINTLAGKLEEELQRVHRIVESATDASLVVLNEIFNSTTLDGARVLGSAVLNRLCELDAIGVCITFIDELASLNDKTVSMVSTIAPDDPATRTYKIVRRPADGRAYAMAIAQKYGLTYDQLTSGTSS